MESASENVLQTPEEELDEEGLFSDPSNLKLSEEKQKEVLLKYIQEKRELQELLEIKEKCIQDCKAKIYDLTTQLEKKHAAKATAHHQANKSQIKSPPTTRAAFGKSISGKKTKKSHKKKGKNASKVEEQDVESGSTENIDEEDAEEAAKDLARYKEIAIRFPELRFSVILESEKRFHEADTNGDGMIDEVELEQVLDKLTHYMTTKKEVKEIMNEVDNDNTGTIDLMEYMAVMERVQMRKRTNLPPHLTKSQTCAIQ